MDRGQELAVTAFTALSTELRTALTKGGVAEAVNSCHVSAQFLTDSVAASLGATIRRTTLKPRNPVNAPDAREAEVLASYQQRADSGLPLQPQLAHEHETVYYYAPILMQDLCLKCHGTPGETISEQDYALILEKYPDDQAIGYKAGDWRGMWSIAFDAETH